MHKLKPSDKRHLAGLVLGIFILLVSCYGASQNISIAGWEKGLVLGLNHLPEWLSLLMLVLTQFGSVWLIFGLIIALIYRHRYSLALRILGASGAAYILVELVKQFVQRPRPFEILSNVANRELSVSDFGFPSGHTAMVLATAITLWPFVSKQYRWLLWLMPIMVAISRMYLGVHAPLDIIGGAAIGMMTGVSQRFLRHLPFIRAH